MIEYWTQDTLSEEALLSLATFGETDFAIPIQSKTRYSFPVYASRDPPPVGRSGLACSAGELRGARAHGAPHAGAGARPSGARSQ